MSTASERLKKVKAIMFDEEEQPAFPQTVRFQGKPQTKPIAQAKPVTIAKPGPKTLNAKIKKTEFAKNGRVMVMTLLGANSQMYKVHIDADNYSDMKAFSKGSVVQLDFVKGVPHYTKTIKRKVSVLGVNKPDKFNRAEKFAGKINAQTTHATVTASVIKGSIAQIQVTVIPTKKIYSLSVPLTIKITKNDLSVGSQVIININGNTASFVKLVKQNK